MTRAIIQYARGALVEAEADGRAALDALPHPGVWFVPHAHGWLAQILVEALTAFAHTNPPASYPAWRSLAALAHHGLGNLDAALELARDEVELARAWGAPRTLGRALRIPGLIEGGTGGTALIREAVSVLADSPARLEHAYALADLGAALRRTNQRAGRATICARRSSSHNGRARRCSPGRRTRS